MTINEKIDKYVLAQGNQVGSGAELAEILKEMVEEMPGPPGRAAPDFLFFVSLHYRIILILPNLFNRPAARFGGFFLNFAQKRP